MKRIIPILLLVISCTRGPTLPADGNVNEGTWGGDNAGLVVGDTVAHLHVGCTNGYFPGPIHVDADGRFSVNGTYVLRAYPVFIGPYHPALFTGTIDGDELTIRVAVSDTVEKKIVNIGPVTVKLGRDPRMQVCPICRTTVRRDLMRN